MIIQPQAFPALFSAATLILDPLVAKILKEKEGFNTKEEYSRWMSENVNMIVEGGETSPVWMGPIFPSKL